MSKIEKLQVQGIRSFGNEPAAINIFSPLTLIVGYNGSGKTTIIECLKYATTGELPPNSKGGAFIHDPKLTGEREQWAQVKMQFKATTGARMVITRNLQLSVRKNGRQQKTMECNLMMSKDGEKASISSRVAELDAVVPQYLGVSKAILENVIFCHQDESLWPMSEPSVLKKKFDEIFEAQKYTKAIDNIKQLRKKQIEELGKFKIIEQHAKEDKDRADKAKKRSRQLSEEIEHLRSEAQALDRKAQEAKENAEAAQEKVARFTGIVERLKLREEQRSLLLDNVQRLSENLEERSDTDEELKNELESHEERMTLYQRQEEEGRLRYEEICRKIFDARGEQSKKRTEAGKYREQSDALERKAGERQDLVNKLAKQHGIRGFEADLNDMQISEFMNRLTKLSQEHTVYMDKTRQENDNEIEKIQHVLHGIIQKRSAQQNAKTSAKDQLNSNDASIKRLQSASVRFTIDDGAKSIIETNIEELEKKLSISQQEISRGDWKLRSQSASSAIKRLEERANELNNEFFDSMNQSATTKRIEILQKDMKDKQRSLEVMLKSCGEKLRTVLGHDIDTETVEKDASAVLDKNTADLREAERKRGVIEKELEQVDFKISALKDQSTEKGFDIVRNAKNIKVATDGSEPEEYLDVLEELQENRDTRANDVRSFEVLKKWYSECVSTAQSDKPACRLCKRAFDDLRAVDRFVKSLEKHVSTNALLKLQDDLAGLEKSLQAARDVRGSYDHWLRLSKEEVPSIRNSIEVLQKERIAIVSKVESHDEIVKTLEATKEGTEKVVEMARSIHRVRADITGIERQIRESSADICHEDLKRGSTEIKAEIDNVNQQLKETRELQEKLHADERRHRDQIAKLEIERSAAKTRLVTTCAELDSKLGMERQIEELVGLNKDLLTNLEHHNEVLESLEPELRQEQDRLNQIRQQGQEREFQLQERANEIRDSLRMVTRIDQEVRALMDRGGTEKLQRSLEHIQQYNELISQLEEDLDAVNVDKNRIQKYLSSQDRVKRVIQDNIDYRTAELKLRENAAEIEELVEQNAKADHSRYSKDLERWEKAHTLASTERTSKMSTMKAKDDQLMQLLDEWDADYKNAAQKYKKAHVEVETTKAAADDLGRYGSALDKAIMRYHSIKMEEINRIIEELWKRTYRGTDIDTISIRSDNETNKGNRSYNYRVCMVKQDAEMDMRGRCSAGQRVLASIIIRLALAECFGINCGLIALDEPTTNLDRDNIRSLAESLHDIINARRAQSNFQLIVITHDEEFLRYMRCSDFCENYFRVQRNDRQKSEIWRNSIADVM